MILPPRTLAIRLVFWTALLVYAIWNLRDRRTEEVFPEEPPPAAAPAVVKVPLPPPAERAASVTGEAPGIVDIEAAVRAMDAAAAGLTGCGVTGTFGVRLAAEGLAEGWIVPASPEAPPSAEAIACAARAAWSPRWPRTTQGFEMERALQGSVAP